MRQPNKSDKSTDQDNCSLPERNSRRLDWIKDDIEEIRQDIMNLYRRLEGYPISPLYNDPEDERES